ncbi:hypothetical protein [Arthrobacter subterraneus]|uniref:hypothetical protein n=1 Tax=Arthrobacter subterraneus TaxID=335973 RepID=UPI00381B7BAE
MTMETYISGSRSWRAPVPFLDFTVDGEPLIATVLGEGSDRMPTRLQPEWEQASLVEQIRRLSTLEEPDYEDGRTAMYICRCGDLDCPSIGARITRSAETIIWSDWAWKDGLNLTDPIDELGSYTFTISEYERALADAAERLSRVSDWKPPAWDPPKQKMLWPWQWGWRLPWKEKVMTDAQKAVQKAIRTAFLEVDPAGLGFGGTWFPESEYDTEVDRALAWLSKGSTPEDTAARTVSYIERDWGVDVQPGKQERLAHSLGTIDISAMKHH